jgi:hypothetical protein
VKGQASILTSRARSTAVVAALAVAAGAVALIATSRGETNNGRVAQSGGPTTHVPQIIDGRRWAVTTFTNEVGQHCINDNPPKSSPEEEGGSLNCLAPERRFNSGPVAWAIGARQQPGGEAGEWANVWVYGEAMPNVDRLEIITVDCVTHPVEMDSDGVFLQVFARSSLETGSWPFRLRARGARGEKLASVRLPLDVPPTAAARATRATAPKPAPQCADSE